MQILKIKDTIDFMSVRVPALVFSGLLIIASVASLAINNLNWGLDFTGGTVVHVEFDQAADLTKIRQTMDASGYEDAIVQNFGASNSVQIRLPANVDANAVSQGNKVLDVLKNYDPSVDLQSSSFIGPSVGEELAEQGGLGMLVALICILAYVAVRFEWRFALGSVIALAHDVIITLGLFSVLQLEFDLTVLAAVLAVIGYSLNDTIVVSDRIRENFRKVRKGEPAEIINISLTQTLNRTIITSLTTVLVLLALFFQGGALIHGFATALLFGVVIGTYSSIYVASLVALMLGISKEDLMPPQVEKEGADQEMLP